MSSSIYILYYNIAASTHDEDVFSFYPDDRPCYGFEGVLARYRELVPHIRLAGAFLLIKSFGKFSLMNPSSLFIFSYVHI